MESDASTSGDDMDDDVILFKTAVAATDLAGYKGGIKRTAEMLQP